MTSEDSAGTTGECSLTTVRDVAYVVACLVAPAAWGWVMVRGLRWLERRRRGRATGEGPPPVDYSI